MGMTGKEIVETQKKYYLQSWAKQKDVNPIPMEKAEGIYLWDYDGNRYTDMSSTQVNVNLGYGNEDINNAMKEQIDKFAWMGPGYGVESRAKLAKMIVDLMPDNMGKVFFTNGGADANENAIKMARMYTGRYKVMSRYRSYHGSTFGAGNLTGEPRRFPLEPGIPGFVKFFDPYLYRESIRFESEEAATEFYIAKLREQIIYEGRDQIAAIILETVTGTNGIIIPPKGYLQGVRKLCDEFGIVMICDEVMAGWCRTGKMFAFMNFDVKPDIVTFAKGVTCGYIQLGGACVNYYTKANILDNVNKVGAVLAKKLDEFKEKYNCVGDVRHIGLFSCVEFVKDKKTKEPIVPYGQDPYGKLPKIIGSLRAKGFLTFGHENMVLCNPPLIITEEQLLEELNKLEAVIQEVADPFYMK